MSSGRALDVCLREILPFVEKRSAADLGLSVAFEFFRLGVASDCPVGRGQRRTRRQQSRVAAEIVEKVLVGLRACERNGRDALLKKLYALRQRLLAFNARELVFERRLAQRPS
jgi:hypothetical protein